MPTPSTRAIVEPLTMNEMLAVLASCLSTLTSIAELGREVADDEKQAVSDLTSATGKLVRSLDEATSHA